MRRNGKAPLDKNEVAAIGWWISHVRSAPFKKKLKATTSHGAFQRRRSSNFRLAASESAAEWEKFLTDLYRRGLTGEGLDMICVDGGAGLLAALPTILPGIAVQRCWAHK